MLAGETPPSETRLAFSCLYATLAQLKLQQPETTSPSPDQVLTHLADPGEAEAKYRTILATMMDGFALLDASGRILEANDAYCRMVGYSPEEIVGMRVAQLEINESQQDVVSHIHHIQTRGWDRFETRHRHKDGTEVPLEISTSCLDRTRGLLVVFARDLTERKRLRRQILEISDREQARIGQDLHDGLCQQLVTLSFDANSLERELSNQGHPLAATVRRFADLLDQSITEARQVARGLFPIRLKADGLASALEELARTASQRFQVVCRLQTSEAVAVKDPAIATHLYRIAQEALNNAVQHGRPKHIIIKLLATPGMLELSVEDDGCGIPSEPLPNPGRMGLHIMDYRARAIGATLRLAPGLQGGTTLTCCLNT